MKQLDRNGAGEWTRGMRRLREPLLALFVLSGTPAVEAAPTAAELRCYSGKMASSVYHAKKLGRCHGKLARGGSTSDFEACVGATLAGVESRILSEDEKAAASGFVCAGDLETLQLEASVSWQETLAASSIFQANALPNACVDRRAKALSKYAAKYANCLRRDFDLGPGERDACAESALPAFRSAWDKAGSRAPCTSDERESVAGGVVAAVDAQADLLHVACGDGVPSGYEQCDDGNLLGGDGCDEDCIVEECGNGVLQAGEACDDQVQTATCEADCTVAFCGNGMHNPAAGEQCDTAGVSAGCEADCTRPVCGDGTLNPLAGEQCDDGGESAVCDSDCTPAACGDGTLNLGAGEQCDDGAAVSGDGCSAACALEACGNGSRQDPEECDDGNAEDGDGCTSLCRRETCAAVGEEVRCLWCPDGSQPDASWSGCTCAAGYEPAGSSCQDIDECAGDPCGGAPCDNLPGTWSCPIACTEAAFHAALQGCGGASRTITFDCADTTILLSGGDGPRQTGCDHLLIDGLDRNISFELNPKCWGQAIPAEQCRVPLDPDGTCPCPDENSGTVFLSLEGDNSTVRNLAVRYFFDGIKTAGSGNTVENVSFERTCDESIGSISGVGNLFTGIRATTACGKCMQNYGNFSATAADPRLREHYNAIVRDSLFTDCQQPIRMTNAGRYLIESTRMEGFFPSGMFRCLGPRFTSGPGDTQVVHMTDVELDGCDDGVRIGGNVQALVWNNTFVNNEFRGLLANANSRVVMWDNVVRYNGGLASSELGLGGVGITDTAQVDLGGGSLVIDGQVVSSPGRNILCDNVGPQGTPREVHNVTATTVTAENNYWCTADPPSRVTGPVDTDPFLSEEP
ncbi:MAG: DUF4215 domain-containing protein [Candidatus Binatia bacterium]